MTFQWGALCDSGNEELLIGRDVIIFNFFSDDFCWAKK